MMLAEATEGSFEVVFCGLEGEITNVNVHCGPFFSVCEWGFLLWQIESDSLAQGILLITVLGAKKKWGLIHPLA